jgi:hypothetical protein
MKRLKLKEQPVVSPTQSTEEPEMTDQQFQEWADRVHKGMVRSLNKAAIEDDALDQKRLAGQK